MKERWKQLAAKFDAKAPRERLLMAACLVAVLVYGYVTVFIDPLLTAKGRLARDITQSRSTLQTFETMMKGAPAQADPAAARQARIETLHVQIANLDKEMQGLQKTLVPPQEVAKLLESVLARHKQLQLVSLHKLPVQRLTSGPAPASVPAKGPAAAPPKDPKSAAVTVERAIYRHSFELTLQGSYAGLHDYLAQLEKLPWQMYWGRISVDARAYPQLTATITVHTVSMDKAWLVV